MMDRAAWGRAARLAKRSLAKHQPVTALEHLKKAREACPDHHAAVHARLLYLQGLCFVKLGRVNNAIDRWIGSLRLCKSRESRNKLRVYANDYGMRRQPNPELDDWYAFYALHLRRYLETKRSRRLGTLAERDMIRELIWDHYQLLFDSQSLNDACAAEKLRAFRQVRIVFPFFDVPHELGDKVVAVNFHEKRKIEPDDRCHCGSGLDYRFCCGRTRGDDELLDGVL